MANCERRQTSWILKFGTFSFMLCVIFSTLLYLTLNTLHLTDGIKLTSLACVIVLLTLSVSCFVWVLRLYFCENLESENIQPASLQKGHTSLNSNLKHNNISDPSHMHHESQPTHQKATILVDESSHAHLDEGSFAQPESETHASQSTSLELFTPQDEQSFPLDNFQRNVPIRQIRTLSICKNNASGSLKNEEFAILKQNCDLNQNETNATEIVKNSEQAEAAEINISVNDQNQQNLSSTSNETIGSNASVYITQNSNHPNLSPIIHHKTTFTEQQESENDQSNLPSPSVAEKNARPTRFNVLNYISRFLKINSLPRDSKQNITTYSESIDSLESKLDAFRLFPSIHRMRKPSSVVGNNNQSLTENEKSQAFKHKQGISTLHQSTQKRQSAEQRTSTLLVSAIVSSSNNKNSSFFNRGLANNTRKHSSLDDDLEPWYFSSDSEYSPNNSMITLNSNSEVRQGRQFSSMFSVNDTINSESSMVSNIDLLQMYC